MYKVDCYECKLSNEIAGGDPWECCRCGARLEIYEPVVKAKDLISPLSPLSLAELATLYAEPVIDFAFYQGSIDFSILASRNVIKNIIRFGQGCWEDTRRAANVTGCINNRLSFDAYWYLDPAYSPEINANKYIDLIRSTIDGWMRLDYRTMVSPYGSKFRIWLDIEKRGSYGKTQLAAYIDRALTLIEQAVGMQCGIYTRASFWDPYVGDINRIWERPMWVAHYGDVNSPNVPKPWLDHGATWELWQYSAKGGGVDGSYYGMESHGLDMSYLHAAPAMATDYAWSDAPPVIEPPEYPEYPYDLFVDTSPGYSLSLRFEPDTSGGDSTRSGMAPRNSRIRVEGVELDSRGREWVKLVIYAAKWLTRGV